MISFKSAPLLVKEAEIVVESFLPDSVVFLAEIVSLLVSVDGASFTVTLHTAFISPTFAVITAVPFAFAVTVPPETVATVSSLLIQSTVPEAPVGAKVAVNLYVSFTFSVRVDLSRETPATGIFCCASFSLQTQVPLEKVWFSDEAATYPQVLQIFLCVELSTFS